MEKGVKGQNVREFTVKICNLATGQAVGTGIAIFPDGDIVTCRHVVELAVGDSQEETELLIYFPAAKNGREKSRRAQVKSECEMGFHDDILLLRLLDGPAPLPPEQLAQLGEAELSEGNAFRSFGFRSLDAYKNGLRASGVIEGCIPPPDDGKI